MRRLRWLLGLVGIVATGCWSGGGGPQTGGQSGSGGMCLDGLSCLCALAGELGPYVVGVVTDLAPPASDEPVVGPGFQAGPRTVVRVEAEGHGVLTGFADQCGGGVERLAAGDEVLAFFDPGDCEESDACVRDCGAAAPFACVAECLHRLRATCIPEGERSLRLAVLREGEWTWVNVAPFAESLAPVLLDEAECLASLTRARCEDTVSYPAD